MKKLPKSAAILLLLSTFTLADSTIVPAQKPLPAETGVPVPAVNSKNFYAGLGYAYMKMHDDTGRNDLTGHAATVLVGYNFHKYIATEGRYSATWGDLDVDDRTAEVDKNGDMSNIAIYLKPKYSIDKFTLYGLLGYGRVSLDDHTEHSESGFQWGLGANFAATDKVDVVVDYTKLYDDKGFDDPAAQNDIPVDVLNLGVVYNF
jgi:opacity protein-like surface antigen